jgi:ketopantoate hydroxymethyltransferase
MEEAARAFRADVASGDFPGAQESFSAPKETALRRVH